MAAARYLTAAEVAEQLRISVGALYQRRWRGTAPKAVKNPGRGGKLLFSEASLKAWEEQHTT